jgi:predicted ATPase
MIDAIEISNFRAFKRLEVDGCAPINIVVGENGASKTALLEAIFLTLCHSPEKGVMLRQFRGNEPRFAGDVKAIVEALYEEFFHKRDLTSKPTVRLRGDGQEARSLSILLGRGDVRIPKGAKSTAEAQVLSPIVFEWTDAKKVKRRAGVKISAQGIEFENTGERVPRNWFFFAAQGPIPARENADRFNELRRKGQHKEFVALFADLFPWVEDILIESIVGAPVLSAIVDGVSLPLTAVSGGINRMAAILLAIALEPKGIVLVDEIENGIFYAKHLPFCRALLRYARKYECQLFLSSHSKEWLTALAEAAGKDVADISLWRIERAAAGPSIARFAGRTFKAGIEHGTDVRG